MEFRFSGKEQAFLLWDIDKPHWRTILESQYLRQGAIDELALVIACQIPLGKLAHLDNPYSPAVGRDHVLKCYSV